MAQLPGTNISAGIRPNDSADVFDTHDAKYGKGGWHTGSATLADRNAITVERRDWYMVVPLGDGTKWELVPGLSSQNLTDNNNWRLLTIGGNQQDITYYTTTGQNTDGAMTQKAVTDALTGKANTSHTHTASQITDFSAVAGVVADARIDAQKGQPNGLASLDGAGKVPVSQLPAYVSEVQEYPNLAAFPATGAASVIYVALDTNLSYRWTGSQYTKIGDGQGVESFNGRTGNITLTQADVDAFLADLKADVAELQGDVTQLEADVTRIDNDVDALQLEVDIVQAVIPAYASPTDMLVTRSDIADLTGGGNGSPVITFTATVTVGGITAGMTVKVNDDETGRTIKLQLAPAQAPSASINAPDATRERGSATGVQLNWSVTPRTNPIASIQVAGQSQNPAQLNGTVNVSTAPDTDTDFYVVVTDTQGLSSSAGVRIDYMPARYFGSSALTPDQIKGALQDGSNINPGALGFTKQLSDSKNVNNNYDCSGGKYIYVLYDSNMGVPSLVRSGLLDFSAYTVEEVTIKDVFGISRPCKLLYTGIQFGSSVNLNIVS